MIHPSIIQNMPPGIMGQKPPPVQINPDQVHAIYKQINDHLAPSEVQELHNHITPRLVQLLHKSALPQFAGLFEPALAMKAQRAQAPQMNMAQQMYQNIKGCR